MKKEQQKELKNLLMAHRNWSLRQIRDELSFKTSQVTVDNYKKKLTGELAELMQYQNGEKARELTETLKLNLEQDMEELRTVGMDHIRKAIKDKDEDEILIWFREAIRSTDSRAKYLRAFEIKIDQSTTNVTIEQRVRDETAREIFRGPLKCPHCGRDVIEDLLRQHVRELEE